MPPVSLGDCRWCVIKSSTQAQLSGFAYGQTAEGQGWGLVMKGGGAAVTSPGASPGPMWGPQGDSHSVQQDGWSWGQALSPSFHWEETMYFLRERLRR